MSKSTETKTLLVIGNGFDLAHGLKTKYTDFLDFVNAQSKIRVSGIPDCDFNTFKNCQYDIQHKLESSWLSPANLSEYMPIGNIWMGYFNNVREHNNQLGENWVDFEKEIEDVIQKIEYLITNNSHKKELHNDANLILITGTRYMSASSKTIVQELIPRLEWDLKILSYALESYLNQVEDDLKQNQLPLIESLPNVSAVISYNYTNTWQRLYGKDFPEVTPFFIHGQLGEHNLVLGSGETLSHELESFHTECASFKKFFQRVKYRLGNGYYITDDNSDIKWQVIIYGHSLDPTDKGSLRWLLGEDQNHSFKFSKIIIYYYDEKSYNQQIANAIQIIGKEALINNVHSGKLIFTPIPK